MSQLHPRMQREIKTIRSMIALYCQDHHDIPANAPDALCDECNILLDYALLRLDNCPFQENKTTCGNCPIHCYKKDMREKVREVMRYSGPRMMKRHPWLAIGHVIDSWRKKPGPKKRRKKE